MFPLASQNEKEDLSVVFDIQSGLVRGSLVSINKNQQPKILQIITRPILRRGHTDSAHLIKMMLKSLSLVAYSLTHHHHVSSAQVVLSSPWLVSYSKTVTVNFDKETLITSKIIKNLIEEGSEKKSFDNDVVYIEQNIFEIKLNGYAVTRYIDRLAKNIDISFAATMSSKNLLGLIDDVFKKSFGIPVLNYHSNLILNFLALRKVVSDMNSYVYVHIHNELTDIVIVKNNLCAHISSFPIGTSALTRLVSGVLKQDTAVADSTLSLYQGKKLDFQENQKVSTCIEQYKKEWSDNYIKSIETSFKKESIPRIIYVSSHLHVDIYKQILDEIMTGDIHFLDLDLDTTNMQVLALNDMLYYK